MTILLIFLIQILKKQKLKTLKIKRYIAGKSVEEGQRSCGCRKDRNDRKGGNKKENGAAAAGKAIL